MTARVGVAVVIEDAHLGRTEAIARDLAGLGLLVNRVVPEAGAIFATAEAEGVERALSGARALSGVLEARPEGAVGLPPMSGQVPQ